MRRNSFLKIVLLIFVFAGLFMYFASMSAMSFFDGEMNAKVSKNSILVIDLEGIIMDGKKFQKQLKKYRKDDHIKAVVVNINSPGGVVGPSQELNAEIKKIRDEFKKPVVAYSANLMASGAYYAAVAADKIVVAPGALVGSIGVIMEFANLEKLYEWAKVSRFTITTGKFKDSGSEYRSMRDDERELFQEMINDVYEQFLGAIIEGRNLKDEAVRPYADGRVMTGAQAVKLGFADEVGTMSSAIKMAAEMAKLGEDFEIFEPPKGRPNLMDFLSQEEDASAKIEDKISKLLKVQLMNQPLFMMPGIWN
jgi:protease IV